MDSLRLILIAVAMLALINMAEAWFIGSIVKAIGVAIKGSVKAAKSAKEAAKHAKPATRVGRCMAKMGIYCDDGSSQVIEGNFDIKELIKKGILQKGCHAKEQKCKRSVESSGIMFPISDEFTDYDHTRDKLISYEEFVFTIMEHFPMAAPEELREPFTFADVNGDGVMDMDEFKGAPFLFAHFEPSETDIKSPVPIVNTIDTLSDGVSNQAL